MWLANTTGTQGFIEKNAQGGQNNTQGKFGGGGAMGLHTAVPQFRSRFQKLNLIGQSYHVIKL